MRACQQDFETLVSLSIYLVHITLDWNPLEEMFVEVPNFLPGHCCSYCCLVSAYIKKHELCSTILQVGRSYTMTCNLRSNISHDADASLCRMLVLIASHHMTFMQCG
jgi:hypothetical protein